MAGQAEHRRPLIDAVGVEHAPCQEQARIVSLVPSITELLFDLGLGASLVGRTRFCVHPRERAKTVPEVGGTKQPKMEQIRALRPTHAVVNVDENTKADFDTLRSFVPSVIATHPLGPMDNRELFRLLGGIFNREHDAGRLCEQFDAALEALAKTAAAFARQRVLYLIWRNPWMTVSRDTYVSRMLALVNWHTVGHDARVRYPVVDSAQAASYCANVILFSSEPFPFKQKHVDEFRRATASEGTCVMVDGEMLSWYGSRAIKGLDYLGRLRERLEDQAGHRAQS